MNRYPHTLSIKVDRYFLAQLHTALIQSNHSPRGMADCLKEAALRWLESTQGDHTPMEISLSAMNITIEDIPKEERLPSGISSNEDWLTQHFPNQEQHARRIMAMINEGHISIEENLMEGTAQVKSITERLLALALLSSKNAFNNKPQRTPRT